MANTIFFKIDFSGKTFKPALLPKQEYQISEDLESYADLRDFIIPDESCMRFPMKTVLASDDWTFNSDKVLKINTIKVIHYGEIVYYHGVAPEMQVSINTVDMYVDYLIEQGETSFAKTISDCFAGVGLVLDFDAKIAKAKEEEVATATAAGGFKAHIEATYPTPDMKKTGFHVEQNIWNLLIRNGLRMENTMLIGPTGTGKTEVLQHVAEALGKKLYIVDMGTVQDAQSALLGVHRLNEKGFSEFDYAPFAKYIQEDCIILLDELSRAPLSAANILFPCLDRRRYLPIDIAGDGEERHIPVHENTMFFATANLGSEYTGTHAIDRALIDRFFPVELDYPIEKAEIDILAKRTGIDKKIAKAIVKISRSIRSQYKEQELSTTVSVRHTLQTAALVTDGFDLVTSLNQVILPLFDDGNGAGERAKVRSIIAAL
jgi:MoxR-like ATPase